ncbi:hypothetical protein [Comamonas sp. A7-5]|uniref:hypothetical protein n=1 Tax=Comamonas sp. A7-5 TaxID=673549 RepID=UPI0031D1E633
MKKLLEGLFLLVGICIGVAWLAVPDAQADEPSSPAKMPCDEFVCPGMHAEWLDEKTVRCLHEWP